MLTFILNVVRVEERQFLCWIFNEGDVENLEKFWRKIKSCKHLLCNNIHSNKSDPFSFFISIFSKGHLGSVNHEHIPVKCRKRFSGWKSTNDNEWSWGQSTKSTANFMKCGLRISLVILWLIRGKIFYPGYEFTLKNSNLSMVRSSNCWFTSTNE